MAGSAQELDSSLPPCSTALGSALLPPAATRERVQAARHVQAGVVAAYCTSAVYGFMHIVVLILYIVIYCTTVSAVSDLSQP